MLAGASQWWTVGILNAAWLRFFSIQSANPCPGRDV